MCACVYVCMCVCVYVCTMRVVFMYVVCMCAHVMHVRMRISQVPFTTVYLWSAIILPLALSGFMILWQKPLISAQRPTPDHFLLPTDFSLPDGPVADAPHLGVVDCCRDGGVPSYFLLPAHCFLPTTDTLVAVGCRRDGGLPPSRCFVNWPIPHLQGR